MSKVPEIYTALDLELNQDESTGPRIIQIGIVVGNIYTGEILEKRGMMVNPYQALTPFIIGLTGITQEMVDKAQGLNDACFELESLHKKHGSFWNPLVWGHGDVSALRRESGKPIEFFGRREIDVKTTYIAYLQANKKFPKGGLSTAMRKMGLKFEGIEHRADEDALNTFIFHRHMLSLLKVKNET